MPHHPLKLLLSDVLGGTSLPQLDLGSSEANLPPVTDEKHGFIAMTIAMIDNREVDLLPGK